MKVSKVFGFLPHFYDEKSREVLYCYGDDDPVPAREMWKSVFAAFALTAAVLLLGFWLL